jgi:glycosyltransferase involved in cell wall biosynthesis
VRFHDRQLAERLAAYAPVLYVEPPVSPRRARALGCDVPSRPTLRHEAPGLARLTSVVVPFPTRPGVSAATARLTRAGVRRAVSELDATVDVVIGTSTEISLYGMGERLRAHWAQDSFVDNAELIGQSERRLARALDRIADEAEIVVAANPIVAEQWRRRGLPTELIPYGADVELFAAAGTLAPACPVTLPGPIAAFMGHLGERIDYRLLHAVADRGVSLLLIGPRHPRAPHDALTSLLARPNVQWIDQQPFEALPSFLGSVDLGLVPYSDMPFNVASFPLKTLEYLAAGCGVVSTDLPATRWLDTHLIVATPPAPEAFADAVAAALAVPGEPGTMARRRAFAAQHSWDVRASAFADAIGIDPIEDRNQAVMAGGTRA